MNDSAPTLDAASQRARTESKPVSSDADQSGEAPQGQVIWKRSGVVGAALGVLAAVAYTTANLGLRSVAPGGDLAWASFVVANKTTPVSLIAWGIILWRISRGRTALPPRELILPLIVTGFVMQFVANMSFQTALGQGGLALTVPLAFSTIILSGAILGRMVLKEPITPRLLMAMTTMIAAVAVLSQGAQAASGSMVADADWRSTTLAVTAACIAGCGYGSCGVMIRRCVTQDLSYASTIVFISSMGPLVLGPLAVSQLGISRIAALPAQTWLHMLGAGLANAVAFFSINAAYKHLSVLRVNLINGSQAAMAATAGVIFFAEPNTWALQIGTLLTVAGLVLSTRRRRPGVRSQGTGVRDQESVTLTPDP